MIPILSGILARSGPDLSARRGFVLSTSYVLAAAVAYAALGVAAALSGQNLQVALQAPAALIAMSAVFALLAVSMFGFFELQLPQAGPRALGSRASIDCRLTERPVEVDPLVGRRTRGDRLPAQYVLAEPCHID